MFLMKYHSEIQFVVFYLAFCKSIETETGPETETERGFGCSLFARFSVSTVARASENTSTTPRFLFVTLGPLFCFISFDKRDEGHC